MEETRNAYKVLVGNSIGNRTLDVLEVGFEDERWMELAQARVRWWALLSALSNLWVLLPGR
jgi:hypothetical protein